MNNVDATTEWIDQRHDLSRALAVHRNDVSRVPRALEKQFRYIDLEIERRQCVRRELRLDECRIDEKPATAICNPVVRWPNLLAAKEVYVKRLDR